MAKVKQIQICGGDIRTMLSDACVSYLQALTHGTDREKLNFAITLDDGTTKQITFCQCDDGIEVYGNFEGMPNFLDWAKKHTE